MAAAAFAAIIAADFSTAQAQSDETSGRIVARLLDDSRVEFGWQPSGGERVLPRQRYFPADATVDRWLRSSPVEVGGAEIGRINARLLGDGRIEFAFTPTDGERIAPQARYFPAGARVGRWLRSTEIAIGAPAPGYIAISAGSFHTCAIRASSGAIECWGPKTGAFYAGQTDAPTGNFTAVSAGGLTTCAIREGGAIECWGGNYQGQTDAPEGRFRTVSTGTNHTCAIHDNGAIECWGHNSFGQTDAPEGTYTAVSAGGVHTCGLHNDGVIECWGSNEALRFGETQTGEVSQEFVHVGQATPPPGSYTAVSAGATHTCAIRTSGAIACWGDNSDQQGNYAGQTDAPPGRFTAVSAGATHTCAIRTSGAIACWGQSAIKNPGRFIAVSAGWLHTCAIRATGAIACWGWDKHGQTDVPTE